MTGRRARLARLEHRHGEAARLGAEILDGIAELAAQGFDPMDIPAVRALAERAPSERTPQDHKD